MMDMDDDWGAPTPRDAFTRLSESVKTLNEKCIEGNAQPFSAGRSTMERSTLPGILPPITLAGGSSPRLSNLVVLESSVLEWLCTTYPLACCSLALGHHERHDGNTQEAEVASRIVAALCASSTVLACDSLLRQALRASCDAGRLSVYVELLRLCGRRSADEEHRESYTGLCAILVCGKTTTTTTTNTTTTTATTSKSTTTTTQACPSTSPCTANVTRPSLAPFEMA
jgi:hypothetical protein